MRSLYLSITLAMLSTLSLALAAFMMISDRMEKTYLYPVFAAMDELQLESAQESWNKSPAALSAYLGRLDHLFGTGHYLLDRRGMDVLSGRDLAAFLPLPPAATSRGFVEDRYVVTHQSQDGRFWLVSVGPQKGQSLPFAPYYIVVVAVAGILSLLAAVVVVLPIRKLTGVVERFGQGDLLARAKFRRKDEIGELAHSFNEMADRLEQMVARERRLLQDISHELRSPLARLKLAVRLARTTADQATALDRIERDVDRMSALTAEIVEMTRIEGDPSVKEFAAVDLRGILEELVADHEAEAQARNCSIHLTCDFAGEVSGNRELLRRTLENILRNAMRYAPAGTAIEIGLAASEREAVLTIRDYGPGVPEAAIARLFEPFFRVEEARDRASGGIGLGLSIAKRIVSLHAGTLTARNAHPGLQVEIRLPRSA